MKTKLILFISFLLVSTNLMQAQEADKTSRYILISNIIPFYDFEKIRDYVFAEGDKKDYCTNFTDLPHLKIKDTDIELYFASYSSKKNPEIEDYSVMYFVTDFNGRTSNFYIYMADNAKVYLKDYLNLFSSNELENKALSELRQKILLVMNRVKK